MYHNDIDDVKILMGIRNDISYTCVWIKGVSTWVKG
jgi:hypothetical protein